MRIHYTKLLSHGLAIARGVTIGSGLGWTAFGVLYGIYNIKMGVQQLDWKRIRGAQAKLLSD